VVKKNNKRLDELLAENKEHESKYWRVSIAGARHFQSRCAVLPRILGLPLRTVEPDSDSAAIPPRRWAHLMQQRRPKQNNTAGKRHNVDKIRAVLVRLAAVELCLEAFSHQCRGPLVHRHRREVDLV